MAVHGKEIPFDAAERIREILRANVSSGWEFIMLLKLCPGAPFSL